MKKVDFEVIKNLKFVKRDEVIANTYNPNKMDSQKLRLLKQSILDNGFLFPISTIYDPDLEKYVIIDGFHRFTALGELGEELVPIVVTKHSISERLYATLELNKIKGHHSVDLEADVVKLLLENGESEDKIAQRMGVELDVIHRYKQVAGIADMFKNVAYSNSWEWKDEEE